MQNLVQKFLEYVPPLLSSDTKDTTAKMSVNVHTQSSVLEYSTYGRPQIYTNMTWKDGAHTPSSKMRYGEICYSLC